MPDPTEAAIRLTEHLTNQAIAAGELLHRSHAADEIAPIEIDDDGFMHGAGVEVVRSVRSQALATPDGDIDGLAWHWTDTHGAGAANLARRIAAAGDPRSCNAWIDERGLIAQSVSFKRGSWHAGGPSAALFARDKDDGLWKPLTPAQRGRIRGIGANSWAGGIELENVGELRLITADARARKQYEAWGVAGYKVWAGWPFRFDHPERPAIVRPDEAVITNPLRPTLALHRFTPEQVTAAKRLSSACVRRYGLRRENVTWGHCQIDPARRTDPGSLWLGDAATNRAHELGGHMREVVDAIYGVQ